MPKNYSVQLYSVRDAVADDLQGAIARVAEIGFAHLEPYALAERTAAFERPFQPSGVTAPSRPPAAPVSGDAHPPSPTAPCHPGPGFLLDARSPRWLAAPPCSRGPDRFSST